MGGVEVSVRESGETVKDAKKRVRAEQQERKRLRGG